MALVAPPPPPQGPLRCGAGSYHGQGLRSGVGHSALSRPPPDLGPGDTSDRDVTQSAQIYLLQHQVSQVPSSCPVGVGESVRPLGPPSSDLTWHQSPSPHQTGEVGPARPDKVPLAASHLTCHGHTRVSLSYLLPLLIQGGVGNGGGYDCCHPGRPEAGTDHPVTPHPRRSHLYWNPSPTSKVSGTFLPPSSI